MADLYRLIERPPTMAEYRSLISAVGWAEWTNFDADAAALACSLYHVVALWTCPHDRGSPDDLVKQVG